MPITNAAPSEYAGQTIKLNLNHPFHTDAADTELTVQCEDYFDRIANISWTYAQGNPACVLYGMRVQQADLPVDDNVLYVKHDGLGYLVHTTEVVGLS